MDELKSKQIVERFSLLFDAQNHYWRHKTQFKLIISIESHTTKISIDKNV